MSLVEKFANIMGYQKKPAEFPSDTESKPRRSLGEKFSRAFTAIKPNSGASGYSGTTHNYGGGFFGGDGGGHGCGGGFGGGDGGACGSPQIN